ncbi:MAG: hypothetical protein JXA77_03040 [Bacteroidales bacterium]|nr:hypothetical protein [Bacteroidales bacterium]MBN2819960.1 hypothetical protein [Bacteroidales bacterium]
MKKSVFVLFTFLVYAGNLHAQRSIILQNNDKVFQSMKIDTIINHIEDGDTLYLPGGNINLTSEFRIDKELHIIGAGHYPDSTQATVYTNVTGGHIRFMPGSDNSSITGINLYNDMYFGLTSTDSISNITISRNSLNNVCLGYTNFRNAKHTYLNFSENVIRSSVLCCDAQMIMFEKNIINGRIDNLTDNALFTNNIFLYYGSYSAFRTCTGVVAQNNIFVRDDHGLSSSVLNNNLFVLNFAPVSGTNMGSGNIVNNGIDSLFVNSDGNDYFSYDTDYHLHPLCDGIGAGTDGYDVGIYGTSNPYKEAAVPFNPHIRYINISSETSDGLLPVEIHVGAQEE